MASTAAIRGLLLDLDGTVADSHEILYRRLDETASELLGVAGIVSVAAPWGSVSRDALLAASPDHVAREPMDLVRQLGAGL